jgi:hypothetical protein
VGRELELAEHLIEAHKKRTDRHAPVSLELTSHIAAKSKE